MTATHLVTLLPWFNAHSYFLFLIVAIIEGPFVSIAAGTAAALGYYNIYIILILAILGDILGDFLYYGIGYMCRDVIEAPFFRSIGVTKSRLERVENLLHKHTRKAVVLIKVSPLVGPPGIIIMGAARTPFKKFFQTALLIAVPKSIFFALVGYSSGQAYVHFSKTIADKAPLIVAIAVAILIVYFLYRKITGRVTENLES